MLPTIASKSTPCSLLFESGFVDLNELLTRTFSHPTGEKYFIFDVATNQLKTKPEARKKEVACSLDSWARAFLFFTMYRVAIDKVLANPLLKYFDQICLLADPKRRKPFIQLLNYDKFFRSNAARSHSDSKIWLVRNDEAFLEFLDPSTRTTLEGDQFVIPLEPSSTRFFKCTWYDGSGHFRKNCPVFNGRPKSFVGSSFFSRQAQEKRGSKNSSESSFK